MYGMAVTYNGAVDGAPLMPLRNSQWIVADELGSGRLLEGFTLHIGDAKLKLTFPNCESATQRYVSNLMLLADDHFVAHHQPLGSPYFHPANDPRLGDGNQHYLCRIRKNTILTTVHDAVRAHDGQGVAIKEFTPPPGNAGNEYRANIQREFMIMAAARHVSKSVHMHSFDLF